MKNLIATFLETGKDRLKNPLIGTFIFAWLAINWKPISILFLSRESIHYRIDIIEDCYTSFWTTFLTPLIIALIYILFLPHLMWLFDLILKKVTELRKKNQIDQQLFDLNGRKTLASHENELENIKSDTKTKSELNIKVSELNKQLSEKDALIETIRKEFKLLNQTNEDLKKESLFKDGKNKSKNLNAEKFKTAYHTFKKSDTFDYFGGIGQSIRNRKSFPKDLSSIIGEKYLFDNIIEEVGDLDGNSYLDFTDKGLYFWREYVMNITIPKLVEENEEPDDLPF